MVESPRQEILFINRITAFSDLPGLRSAEKVKKSPRLRRIPQISGLLQIGSVYQISFPIADETLSDDGALCGWANKRPNRLLAELIAVTSPPPRSREPKHAEPFRKTPVNREAVELRQLTQEKSWIRKETGCGV